MYNYLMRVKNEQNNRKKRKSITYISKEFKWGKKTIRK